MGAIIRDGIWYGGATVIDNELSTTSENPVQNKVITNTVNEINTNLGTKYPKDWDVILTQTEYDNLGPEKYTDGKHYYISDALNDYIVIDTELSTTSTNPIQNRVITNTLNNKSNSTSLAPAYDSTATYTDGDYVTNEGNLYIYDSVHGTELSGNFSRVNVTDIIGNINTILEGVL